MIKRFFFFLFLCLGPLVCSQQTVDTNKDIKVGLVLSGGGAKGFSHIGVLKVLEEAGVRIDYIGGTSMGAIIGALYASGYNANELDSIISNSDFNELMQDEVPRKSKSIYQKENTEKYAITLPLVKGNIALPSAVSKGQNVFNLLSKLTQHVHDIDDFSKLPIPFFCIATNLENGRAEVLDTGFLPEAIRASGSFPTLLDPVEIDGKLLTDGGVANNFPVDIMEEKGLDFIIGIDVQDKLKTKNNLDTAPRILMQIVSFQMYGEVESKRKETDLYLRPDISNFNVVSFDLAREIIDNGEQVARKQLRELKKIAANQRATNTSKETRAQIKNGSFIIDEISFEGAKNYTNEYLLGKLRFVENDTLSYAILNEGINNLSATGNFRSIEHRFVKKEEAFNLHFKLKEEPVSTFVQFGVHYDDLYKTGALLNYTAKHAIFKNDVLFADFVLGDNIRYNIDYFIDNGFHWSYGIKTRYNKFDKSILASSLQIVPQNAEDEEERIKYNDFTTQFYVQSAFSNTLALRMGVEDKYLRVFSENTINNENVKDYFENTNYLNAFVELSFDTYDDNQFPKKGLYFNANYKAYLISSESNRIDKFNPFTQLKGSFGVAHSIGSKFTVHLISEAGINIGENSNKVLNFHLGGNNQNFINNFVKFYGYDVADLSESGFVKSELSLRYEPFKNHFASFTANAARVQDDLFNRGAIFDDTKTGYAVGYGLKSPIGPIEIKYSWSPDTSQNFWFFNVGFWF